MTGARAGSSALVIGGTAFMGRALVERLLEEGVEVTILHRSRGTPFGDRVDEIHVDRNDAGAVRAALRGRSYDAVYDNVYDWARGTGPEPVVAAAETLADGLGRYVFTSSIAAYGGGTDHDESDALAPADHPDRYVRDKATTERALFALRRERGIPVTTLRPAFVYGPHNPFDREAFFWDRVREDRPILVPGDGSRVMQWVGADEVARAALLAVDAPGADGLAFNLAGPEISQNDFVRALARVAGRDARIVHVPRERIEEAGGGLAEPPFYFGVYLDLPPLTVRNERARDVLGFSPMPLEEGLADAWRWYGRQDRPRPDFAWEDRLLAGAS